MSTRTINTLLVTGGCGFIGSNFIHWLFRCPDFKGKVINLDKLTYAANPENLLKIQQAFGNYRYFFEKGDIVDFSTVTRIFKQYDIDSVVHCAAETHVDRSIYGPKDFVDTNIIGTYNMLESARQAWQNTPQRIFHHISTDEVYGSLEQGFSSEQSPYCPNSPYAASKASSDHLVRAYFKTYGLPVTLSHCSNNFGPFQFPEKLVALMIINAIHKKSLPVYGQGQNIRDWLYVDDHCEAVWQILTKAKIGEAFNISAENTWSNIDLVRFLCEEIAKITGQERSTYQSLITFVQDRPGHDWRYALSARKIKKELGWRAAGIFRENIQKTIRWYLDNSQWVEHVTSGSYRDWEQKHYGR